MKLKRMRYFVAVAEELHFGRAASRLSVVQPALSQQIGLLEKELGVNLLDRSTRKVVLTDAGRIYLIEARGILERVDQATKSARDASGGLVGTLAIGFVDNALWSPLPGLLLQYRKLFPRIDLDLRQMPLGPQLLSLTNGELDLGIMPGPISDPAFEAHELIRAPVLAVLPAGHALTLNSLVDMKDLAREPLITFPSLSDSRRINEVIVALFERENCTPTFGQPVEQLLTAMSLVSAGLGIALVPSWMRRAWTDGVEFRRIRRGVEYSLHVVMNRRRIRPAASQFASLALSLRPGGDKSP